MTAALIALVVSLLAALQPPNVPLAYKVTGLQLAEQVITLAQSLPDDATSTVAFQASSTIGILPTNTTINVQVNTPVEPSTVIIQSPNSGSVTSTSTQPTPVTCQMTASGPEISWNAPNAVRLDLVLQAGTAQVPEYPVVNGSYDTTQPPTDYLTATWSTGTDQVFSGSRASLAASGETGEQAYGADMTYVGTFTDAPGNTATCSAVVKANPAATHQFPVGTTWQ